MVIDLGVLSIQRETAPVQSLDIGVKIVWVRLLHPQHMDEIWSELTLYRLPFNTLTECTEPCS